VAKQAVVSRAQERASRVPVSISPVAAGDLAPIEKQISARSVMVMDAESGESLFEKMADNPRQPASTIKIVTAMIALKSLRNDDVINVSRRAADMPSSKIFLDPNRNYQANDLINAVLRPRPMTPVCLGEKIAGSEDKFCHVMSSAPRYWGEKYHCRYASG
jgi:D-alanyl-D-alanine carboxypeptidase (penicillin-binding protein 5/6)